MNYGDGYYAGAFLAALYTYAYTETDMVQMIKLALKAIPAESQYAQIIQDILQWYAKCRKITCRLFQVRVTLLHLI